MSTVCTRCSGFGFLNWEQIDDDEIDLGNFEDFETYAGAVTHWMSQHPDSDVQVCDCCGDGEDWHGTAGEHYGMDDPQGPDGPYAYNGGLCECH